MGTERDYKLQVHEVSGLPIFEAEGSFSPTDVWDLVGEKSRVATFTLKPNSATALALGMRVVGVPLYSPKERAACASTCGPNLRLEATMHEATAEVRRLLEHPGIPVEHIAGIHFLPYEKPAELHDTGEKKIPNVITIPYEHDPRVSVDRLTQNLFIMKSNDGVELAPFEREQLIGITLAFNDGRIDSRILAKFGFTAETAAASGEVCLHRLETRVRLRKELSAHERQQLDDLQAIRRIRAMTSVIQALQSCRLEDVKDAAVRDSLETVIEAAVAFRPDTLLTGKPRQVFWDVESYVHIALNHIREMQIGSLTAKTPFPYRADDLKMLIGKVLALVKEDIQEHFEQRPDQVFYRAGERSVYFHGDYYSFHINPDGRMTNFHPLGPRARSQ